MTVLTAHSVPEALLLVGAGAVAGGLSWPLWPHLRRIPAVADGVTFQSLDENLENRKRAADSEIRRRTSYASDRRTEPPRR
ncbi:hypothetical protein [Mycolicibacterium vaccae]|uniref:hypothetical protein n=1 Tax=Mycolicibacterium vaccae TaxID=1810 RepID=UPI003D03B6F4